MRLTTVIGARPQFIKASFLSSHFSDCGVEERIIHTGQHYDKNMSAVFFDQLGIPDPAKNLGVHAKTHGAMTGEMLALVEQDLLDFRPDALLVYGDTDSTLAGALAATKLHIPVVHVEAGLRSFDRSMPEETNRVLTDHVSSLLLCPTDTAINNLKSEGITDHVYQVGDVMQYVLDSLLPIASKNSTTLEKLQLNKSEYFVATVHRAENTDNQQRLLSIFEALTALDKDVVIPIHPRTKNKLDNLAWSSQSSKIHLVEPLSYIDMLAVVNGSQLVLTDSGGLQKESAWMGKPCVTLRDNSEWVETIDSGWNILAGAQHNKILEAVNHFLENGSPDQKFQSDKHSVDYWMNLIKSCK